jgi:hypothetical protein
MISVGLKCPLAWMEIAVMAVGRLLIQAPFKNVLKSKVYQ